MDERSLWDTEDQLNILGTPILHFTFHIEPTKVPLPSSQKEDQPMEKSKPVKKRGGKCTPPSPLI